MSDGRIGISHFQVPGFDGDFGFGGTCFPKDINALIKSFEDCDLDPLMLSAAWERNILVRKNKDWESSKSAVTE
jgi:UDPglucose 6-dehydrogenase